VIQHEYAAGTVSFWRAERADVDAVWAAVDGMWAAVACAASDLFGFDGS
jgi:hypothetical protein